MSGRNIGPGGTIITIATTTMITITTSTEAA
jgi:hypothetical protein